MYTYGLESPGVQYAYITIAEFFDTYGVDAALRYTKQLLQTAGSYRYWKGNPSNAVFFLEKLGALVEAALTIHKEEAEREAARVELGAGEVPSLAAYPQYCGWHYQRQPWYFFPRSLNRKEYADPYRVFARLAAKGGRKKWRRRLRELQFYALSTACLNEGEDMDLNTLQLYFLFTKLIDAAHLVDVRAINEINGEKRPKWKGLPEALNPVNDQNPTA